MMHPLQSDLDHVLECTTGIWEALRGRRLFITGGTGFVGTWLVESLVWADANLDLGIDAVLLTRNPGAFRAKAPSVARHKGITLLHGDAQGFRFPDGDFEFVIHAATENASTPAADSPAGTFEADIAATRRVLEFAHRAGTRNLLFTSSGAVYGRQPADLVGIPEDYSGAPSTTDLKSGYGQAKRASEFLCCMHARQFGFKAAIARLFAFVGPHLSLDGYAVGNFLRDAMHGRTIRIESDGSTVRSYLYAADMAAWLWTILLKGESARPYNVGSSQAITVRELAATVSGLQSKHTDVEVLDRPGVPATRYVPDVSRAENELGLRQTISLRDSLKKTLEWHRHHSVPVL
ncbi:MAG: NAD-dependent epimerase/dehydratase family protein [Acidobacteriaceae bacterium]